MAEEQGQTRSEAPTPRRREEARRQGQVAISLDLYSSVLLLGGLAILWFSAQGLGQGLLSGLRLELLSLGKVDVSLDSVQSQLWTLLVRTLSIVGLLIGLLFVISVATGAAQVGFHWVPELLNIKWERILPSEGVRRFFSLSAGIRALSSLLKVAVVAGVAWWVLAGRSEQIAGLGQGVSPSLRGIVVQGWELVLRTALAIAGALAAIAVLDYILQRLRFERSLRMTREEVKEEIKREEGDPQVKARIRRLQRDAAQRRMLRAVPTASVIITNPEHVAVALQYDRATMPAPRVVAKGAGRVAKRIIELGRKSAVPVVERKPLAQALFRTVEVGREIPAGLYFVVAEVLAFVYRQREAA